MAVDIEKTVAPQEDHADVKADMEHAHHNKGSGGMDIVPMDEEATQDVVHVHLTWRSWVWRFWMELQFTCRSTLLTGPI